MMLPLLIAAAAAAQGAPARLSAEQADARCVVVLGFIGSQPGGTPQRMEAVKNGTAYYLGKLRGRNPAIDLRATLDAASKLATAQKVNVGADGKRCGDELVAVAATNGVRPAAPRKP